MVFSSVEFVFYFLPIALLAYFATPSRFRNVTLLAISTVFYTWGGGALVLILGVSVVVDYLLGHLVSWARRMGNARLLSAGVMASLTVNLALLGYFKYANFAIETLNGLGLGEIAWDSVVLPIGISFYTFQSMSYTIDIARGRCEHLSNPVDFALYVALFPQLIAGPIVRFHEISEEIRERSTSWDDVSEGALRFTHGFAKKVIVADAVGGIADDAFAASELSLVFAWVGVIAYTLQIYFDFSGYSDMAIGLGRVLGFRFPENFQRPYSAYSITDFWRRWHITLSNWFRDYLYVPLGGSRNGQRAMYRNLVIVFLATGLWHGANWTFVAWGVFHGVLMLIERIVGWRFVDDAPFPALNRVVTLIVVMFGWVLFRSDNITHAMDIYQSMLGFNAGSSEFNIDTRSLVVYFLALGVFFLPRDFVAGPALVAAGRRPKEALRVAYIWAVLPYTAMLVASNSFSPFLYFQF